MADEESTTLSYKFQRLRERLREAIKSGDLAGKLPGERSLAKRFHVNAKTLSKALTDLAAEGLLDRSIGRGTYVKGSAPAIATAKRWLIVSDTDQKDWRLLELLRAAHPDLDVMTDVGALRPSVLNQFSAVIVLSQAAPDSFIRDLVVRNIAVVVVGDEPRAYSTHAVICDRPLAASLLGRDILLAGHRKIGAMESQSSTVLTDMVRQAAFRSGNGITIDRCLPGDAHCLVEHGVTSFICESISMALQVMENLNKWSVSVPAAVSVVAIGCQTVERAVSGYYTTFEQKADAILTLLQQNNSRPTTIWLSGKYFDCGTMASPSAGIPAQVHTEMHGAGYLNCAAM